MDQARRGALRNCDPTPNLLFWTAILCFHQRRGHPLTSRSWSTIGIFNNRFFFLTKAPLRDTLITAVTIMKVTSPLESFLTRSNSLLVCQLMNVQILHTANYACFFVTFIKQVHLLSPWTATVSSLNKTGERFCWWGGGTCTQAKFALVSHI